MSDISADELETVICIALILALKTHYSSHVSRCGKLQFWLWLFLPWIWPVVLMILLRILFRLFLLLVLCWIQPSQSSQNSHSWVPSLPYGLDYAWWSSTVLNCMQKVHLLHKTPSIVTRKSYFIIIELMCSILLC